MAPIQCHLFSATYSVLLIQCLQLSAANLCSQLSDDD